MRTPRIKRLRSWMPNSLDSEDSRKCPPNRFMESEKDLFTVLKNQLRKPKNNLPLLI